MTRFPVRFRERLACGVLLALLAVPAFAAKTDVITLKNGDRITGEIKEMAYGQLRYDTDNLGTVYVEWDDVVSMTSEQRFQVEMLNGDRYFGRIVESGAPPEPGHMRLRANPEPGSSEGEVDIPLAGVARIMVLDTGTWKDKYDGSISLGYSFAQSTGIETFNLNASIGSRNRRRYWNIELESQITDDDDESASERASLIGTISRPMQDGRYYREGNVEFTRNDELGLKLRSLAGATYGRYLIVTRNMEWRAGLGLAASTEDGTDDTHRESLEGQLSTYFRLFRFDDPETNVTASIVVLPSLSESGRWRGEASLDLRREIVSDLFFSISVYDSYDNRPAEGASTNDWGLTTSIGYSF